MTESELTRAAEALIEIHGRFMTTVIGLAQALEKATDYLEKYQGSFEANLASYHATTEMLSSYSDGMREFVAAMQFVAKTSADNNAAITETNEHLRTLTQKFEDHFGDASGLSYDN